MFDFFDEDFPLSKKQEEAERKRLRELEKSAEDDIVIEQPAADEPLIDLSDVTVEEPMDETPDFKEQYSEALSAPISSEEEAVSEKLSDLAEKAAEDVPEEAPEISDSAPEASDEENKEEPEASEDALSAPEEPDEQAEKAWEEIASDKERVWEDIALDNGEETAEQAEKPWDEIASEKDEEPDGNYDEWSGFEEQPAEESEAETLPEPKSIDEIEAHLHEELRSLGEKLDSMEKAVDSMEDGELPEGFDYEYDERYFSEEDTPAYKHPELYGSSNENEDRASKITMTPGKKPETKMLPVPVRRSRRNADNRNLMTAAAAAVTASIAAAVAVALFSKKKKKK